MLQLIDGVRKRVFRLRERAVFSLGAIQSLNQFIVFRMLCLIRLPELSTAFVAATGLKP